MKHLLQISVIGVALTYSSIAAAGCPITVKFVNKENHSVTISRNDSKVRSQVPGSPVQPPWKRLMSGNVTIGANQTVTKAYSLALGCAYGIRKFKFKISSNGQSFWEKKKLVTTINKKMTLKIKK